MFGIILIILGSWLSVWGVRTTIISKNPKKQIGAILLGPLGILLVGFGGYLLS